MCSVWATPQEQKMSRLIYSKGANKGQKKKKKKRAAKSADAHVTKKGGFEMMGRRTRGSNCNSQCQTKHKTQSGANYNANTKVHKLANLRFFSSGGDWRWWWWWCWKKPNKQDQIKRKRTEFLSARTSRPLCTHKYKCFLVWNRHKKWEIKKKKKRKYTANQPTETPVRIEPTTTSLSLSFWLSLWGENSMGALEFSRSNPSASKGKRINKKAIEKPTENEGRAKNKKKPKKKNTKMGQQ